MTTVFPSLPTGMITHEDGGGQLQGQSEGGIYDEEIRREVELSPLRTKTEKESEQAKTEYADKFPASPLEV